MIASIWFCCLTLPVEDLGPRPHVVLRGLYGGVPDRLEQLEDLAINAVWVGSGGLNAERIAAWKARGAKVFAEFNTMHESAFLKASPDAAPIGADGKPFTDFAVSHEKELHLIVVRSDGQRFEHVHPTMDPQTGAWSVPWTWTL